MSFFGLILLFFFGYFVIWPIIKVLMKANELRRQFGRHAGGASRRYAREPERKAGWSSDGIKRRRKKIEKDVGEYVAFTEERCDVSSRSQTVETFEYEQQVVDVEWEDIK